jgi:hypothetical protein
MAGGQIGPSKEEIGGHLKQLGQLLRLLLADRQHVALAQAVLFHQAAQPAVGRRSFQGVVSVLEAFDQHSEVRSTPALPEIVRHRVHRAAPTPR